MLTCRSAVNSRPQPLEWLVIKGWWWWWTRRILIEENEEYELWTSGIIAGWHSSGHYNRCTVCSCRTHTVRRFDLTFVTREFQMDWSFRVLKGCDRTDRQTDRRQTVGAATAPAGLCLCWESDVDYTRDSLCCKVCVTGIRVSSSWSQKCQLTTEKAE